MTQIAEELLIQVIKLKKGKAREPSKHLQALEQLRKVFKATMDGVIKRVTTPTAPITPTASHSPTHKDTVKLVAILQSCPQHHQQHKLLSHMSPNNHNSYNTILSLKVMRQSHGYHFHTTSSLTQSSTATNDASTSTNSQNIVGQTLCKPCNPP